MQKKKEIGIKMAVVCFLAVFMTCAYVTLTTFTPEASLAEVMEAFTHYDQDNMVHYVVRNIKMPRMIGALIVGALMAVGGAVMQGITRNYLASPDVMGISSGAGVGLTLAVCLSMNTATYNMKVMASLIGATIATLIIFSLSARIKGRESGVKLLLAGTALGTLFSALSSALTLWLFPQQGGGVMYLWNSSGFMGIRKEGIYVLLIGVVGLFLGLLISGKLTVLGMGEDTAIALGENVKLIKLVGVIAVVLISATTVSVVGNIGFIGLIVPNMVKMAVGENYRKVVPYSALCGSMLLVISDVISRLINRPYETPIGTITSIIGIPIFLYLVNAKKSRGAF